MLNKERADWRKTSIQGIEVSTKGSIKVGAICFHRGEIGLKAAELLAANAVGLRKDATFLRYCGDRETRQIALFQETATALAKAYPAMPKADLEALAWLKVKQS